MGLTQSFRMIRFRDAEGLEAADLLEQTADGFQIRPEMAGKVVEDTVHRNKWTRRGLGMIMHQAFRGHGGTYTPPEVTYTSTTNPFPALFLAGDDAGSAASRTIAGNALDTITKSSNQIYLVNGDFTSADVGRLVYISGGTNEGNKGFRVITQVLGLTTIVVTGYASAQGFATDAAENFGGVAVWTVARPGDARVNWNESDGQYDTAIPKGQASSVALFERGSRACLVSDTSGILKRVAVAYVTTAPYREIEYLFYATGVSQSRAITGDPTDTIFAKNNTITMVNGAFVVGDVGKILKISGASDEGNNGQRRITAYISGTQIKTDGQYAADAYEGFMSAFVNDGVYLASNETGYKGLDYLPIKAIGLSEGIACGNGETSNRIGIRSVLGLAPTWQGVCDRTYVHEGTGLHGYTGVETLGTYGDGYVASSSVGDFTGDKAFDGYVQGEGLYGNVVLGEKWQSAVSSNHVIGRVWSTMTAKKLTGIRVTFPSGENKNNCPDNFYIQYLDAATVGGVPANLQPANNSHWTTIGSQRTSQADTMFANGQYGVEYTFSIPGGADAYGVRLSSLNAYSGSQAVMVAELYAFTAGPTIEFVAGSTDQMRLAPLQTPLATDFRNFYFGSFSTTSVATLVNTMNKQLRGYQFEAVRSNFGYLWLRGTVQGNNSYATIDTVANGSTANATLQMPTATVLRTKQGTTQPVMKLPCDALAIIYRFSMSGDLPMP
jgi:hypothetical protein